MPHRDTLVGNLSGGQIKRVSLGAELLAKPCLLYIDEATSGLDAGTESRMMRLFRRLADEGRSIICITHNVDNVDRCHLVLVLARGKLIYYGPPSEAPKYFGVRRISDIYDRLSEKSVEDWEKEFKEVRCTRSSWPTARRRGRGGPGRARLAAGPGRLPGRERRPAATAGQAAGRPLPRTHRPLSPGPAVC